ncbi:hypothetical protein [Colwellia sp. Arc7-D]|uniref:hypothetical protein n=1 Tax=Colwellia sp. Arc7-D TaxID=2161872 RepID=UPI000D38460A|nr:hypothetical protein [Colwellia sp. Arc7-D]AWB57853.1 hypothetical protein DBO93_09900 [Colwellia sp. Arc7-D]
MKNESCFAHMLEQYLPREFNETAIHSAEGDSAHNPNINLSSNEYCKYNPLGTPLRPRLRARNKADCCIGRSGKPKKTYFSFDEAYDAAKYILHVRDTDLEIYPCRKGSGWHLTKG